MIARPQKKLSSQYGFTLVETLIALFIMGVATSSILVLIGQNTRFQVQAEQKLLAAIVADNILVETLATPPPLDRGVSNGDTDLGGQSWTYEVVVDDTSLPGVTSLTVRVRISGTDQVQTEISTLRLEQQG